MEPQLANAIATQMDKDTVKVIAKHLWPTMLFLVVMSLISLFGAYWWNKDNPTSSQIAFWLWFIVNLGITGFGVYAFILDARIQVQQYNSKREPN